MSEQLDVRVTRVTEEAEGIRSFEFALPQAGELPGFTAGSHLDVHLPNGLVRQYSLCNDPRETHRYVVAVLREPAGRGGSACMHDVVREGDDVTITAPRNNFPLHENAERHLLIAGGIGITPMLAMARRLADLGADYTLHYCTRSPERTAFRDELAAEPFASHVQFHHDGGDPAKGLDVRALLAEIEDGTHVYCCGPLGLMHAVTTASEHWPLGTVHFEFFETDPDVKEGPSTGFEVEIASTGAVYQVPPEKTILDVLLDNGHDVDRQLRGRPLRHLHRRRAGRRAGPPGLRPRRRGEGVQQADHGLLLARQEPPPQAGPLEVSPRRVSETAR